MRTYLATLLTASFVLFPLAANANLIFNFEFDNVATDFPFVFNTDGTVRGTIANVLDNTPDQSSGFIITIDSSPTGLTGAADNGLVATNWDTAFGVISTSGGLITAIDFLAAQPSTAGSDQLRLNYSGDLFAPNSNWLSFSGFSTSTGNLQGLSGLRLMRVPVPATLALISLGLAGLGCRGAARPERYLRRVTPV